jgi:hypothetical protein
MSYTVIFQGKKKYHSCLGVRLPSEREIGKKSVRTIRSKKSEREQGSIERDMFPIVSKTP